MVECADHVLCIDHHPAREAPWAHNIVEVAACATTELIFELTVARGWTPDAVAARAIYVGLATDTGFFRFNSTTARGHRVEVGQRTWSAAEAIVLDWERGLHLGGADPRTDGLAVGFTRGE